MRKFYLILFFQLFSFAFALPINVDFFKNFNDEYFEKYIFEALESNHDLKQIQHKVNQFRYEISSQFSRQLPELSVASNYLGTHFPDDNNFLLNKNSYVLPLKASWELDILLKNKDKTKSKKKLYESALANQKGAYISLLCDIANTYINILLFDYLDFFNYLFNPFLPAYTAKSSN